MNVKILEQRAPNLGLWSALRLVPQNLVSYSVGKLTRCELPKPAQSLVNKAFARTFGIDISEAEHSLEEYSSVEDVFCRRLKPGARPIESMLVSPADGILERSAQVQERRAVQAKGLHYSLAELVFGDDQRPETFGWFTTVYLAPHNYHRVHTPVTGTVRSIRYIPGELWPVNQPCVARLPRLFCRNERLIFDIDVDGKGMLHVVMVGAFNVGRMVTPLLPGFATNDRGQHLAFERRLEAPSLLTAGAEIGTFMLGSTVVLVFEKTLADFFQPKPVEERRAIRMGQNLLS